MLCRIQAVFLLSLLLVAGCGGGEEKSPEPLDDDDMDRLSSLPYLGFMADEEDGEDGGLFIDHQRSWPGYTLYTVQMLSLAELIDGDGRVVRVWEHQPSARWERAVLLPGGDLVAVGAEPAEEGIKGIPDDSRYLARFDWDGELLWKRKLHVHHDVEAAPDGRLTVLAFQRRKVPSIDPKLDIRDDMLVWLDEQGLKLDSLSLLDIVAKAPDRFPLRKTLPNALGVVPWVDLFHLNSIEWMSRPDLAERDPIYREGNVLLCSRHQNRIFIVDAERESVEWSWGLGELFGPHDAAVLDSGNILVFDNGLGRGWSRVLEVDPLQNRIVWQYAAPEPESFYTVSKGSNQRLPNGNTLIADSDRGRAFEVTPEGEIVWAFRCPFRDEHGRRAAIVRCYRYSLEFIDGLLARGASGRS